MEILKNWENEEKYFIKTRASEYVMDCILKHSCVSVIGSSGVGKTFLVQHVALEMKKNDYRIVKVNSPKEIETHYISERKTLFVVDDMCGNFTASKTKLNDWKTMIPNINVLFKTNSCKLLLTCRLQVFQDEGFEHSNFEVFKNCICNLNNDKLCLTTFEKQELAKQYFKGTTVDIEHLFQYDFFPFLCQYYVRNKDKSNFCLKTFLSDPFAPFETNINNLFVDDQESKYKFCALLLLVLCNNHIESRYLEGEKDKFKIILKDIQEKCRIDNQLTVELLILQLDTLTGTFLKNEKGIFKTIHDKLFDFLTHYFGTKNRVTKIEFIELLIRHANHKVIDERFVIREPGQSDDKMSKDYIITIEKREDNDQLQLYTARVFDDMTKADRYLLSNKNFFNDTFMKSFLTFIKKLKKENILHFIKSASSLFVLTMFVMDVKDLMTLNKVPCGIILDQEHIKDLVERIFGDMTKSDDVMDYISECRCCRNENFRTVLRTYMLKVSRDKIQELINRASSSFVQLMFVMKEEDLKQRAFSRNSFHKLYGIIIPKDIIHMYMERVVNDISSHTNVLTYISKLRCSSNEVFNNALQRFMNDFLSIRIKDHLKTASISFIQVMCVLTEENIKNNSPHIYKRYGFNIKCDARKEYIERVFDDMTMSDDVDKHIKGNRNRTNTIFQYGLLGLLGQLDRSKIKILIENVSIDFLNRLCVLTVDEIKDCGDDWERYGVVIPEEYIQLYIARWFNGMIKLKNCENHVAQNRNKQREKFKISLRRYLEQLQEDRIEKLIQTASSDFLNKWFVTKNEDIQIDTIKEYEQYGILLKGKNLQMYTERIWTLMNIDKDFIHDMSCNRNTRYVLEYINQIHISQITELMKTTSVQSFHKIKVDVKNDLEKESSSKCQSLDNVGRTILSMKAGVITLPESHINQYIARMISDWRNGYVCAVIENVNMKTPSFVEKFLDRLNHIDQSKKSELINGVNQNRSYSYSSFDDSKCMNALTVCCIKCDVKLAKWCVENHCSGNEYEKHYKMCALFILVVFNNKLEEIALIDEATIVKDVLKSLGRNHDIHPLHEDISAKLLRGALDSTLQGLVIKKNGVYHLKNNVTFDYLFIYFGSIQHFSNILIKFGDVKSLYKTFMVGYEFKDWDIVNLPDTELQNCIERVFETMSESTENIRYVLERRRKRTIKPFSSIIDIINQRIVKAIIFYNKNLKRDKIEKLIKNSCIDFFNKFILIANEATKYEIGDVFRYVIEIPDIYVNAYIKSFFYHMSKSECLEACLNENINKKNETFHTTLSTYLNAINRDEVEILIREASSDFISRMFVISEEDIKVESFWESERYGIVVPDNLLTRYIERVFDDIKNSSNVPENRNNENEIFRDTFHSFIRRSISGDKLTSLIDTASSKCISHMFLSAEGDFNDISAQGREKYFMFVPIKFFKIFQQHIYEQHCSGCSYYRVTFVQVLTPSNNSPTFTLRLTDKGILLLTVTFKNDKVIDNLQQYPTTQLLEQFFTSKTINLCVKSTKSIVKQYFQRLIQDWTSGKVHDVLGNINLSNPSFQREFIDYLMTIDNAEQTKLAKTSDIVTRDSPLAVSCYFGISKLAEWCLENNSNTNSTNISGEHPLYLACSHVHHDIVWCLLNHRNKPKVNKRTGVTKTTPLYEACERGLKAIVLLLLKEDVDVNHRCHEKTPLFVACKYGHIEIVKLLLEHKEDKLYINEGKERNFANEYTPLYVACEKGHTKIVSLLLNHNADTVDFNKNTYQGETPLFAACKGGYTDVVDLLLAREIRVINKSSIDRASPLFIECQERHVEVVSTLLKHRIIEIDQCILIGMSPLFIAALQGHTEIVKMLLEKKADASICMKNEEIVMQVFEKLREKSKTYIKFIKNLVREHASEDVQSYIDEKEEGWVFNSIFEASPLHMGSLMGHTEIVQLLVESNSNVNSYSENGSTPLFLACELGHENIVHILLSKGADPALNRKDEKTPLAIARDNRHMQIVNIIKSRTFQS